MEYKDLIDSYFKYGTTKEDILREKDIRLDMKLFLR